MFQEATITDLPAFRFGHAQDFQKGTGCSVIIAPDGACCGVDVSGGGPATRETDLLKPENTVSEVHALVFSGGSAFGLEASSGVMEVLSEKNIGFELLGNYVPIVPGASLFDLVVGEFSYPDKAMGRVAALAALTQEPFEQGNFGAGCGACVGKFLGIERSTKSGFGFSILRYNSLVLGAFVAVNAIGNVKNQTGDWLAGCLDENNTILDSIQAAGLMIEAEISRKEKASPPTNTTLGAIVCNAKLDKAQATKVSQNTNDAYARAIKPVHTSHDGDVVFTLASGEVDAPDDLVSLMANEAMEQAIRNSVLYAETAYGIISASDLGTI